jgi:hypothetical protein
MRGDTRESIRTYTGRFVWPLDPRAEDIDLLDVAHALAQVNRFNGHTAVPYSVAEHAVRVSVLVEQLARGVYGPVPHAPHCVRREDGHACSCGSTAAERSPRGIVELALWGLHHDDSEYLLVDFPRPMKRADTPLGAAYRDAETHLMTCVCQHFGLPLRQPYLVTAADEILLAVEYRDLMNAGPRDRLPCPPFDTLVDGLPTLLAGTHEHAQQAYLQRHRALTGSTLACGSCIFGTGTAVPRPFHGSASGAGRN